MLPAIIDVMNISPGIGITYRPVVISVICKHMTDQFNRSDYKIYDTKAYQSNQATVKHRQVVYSSPKLH